MNDLINNADSWIAILFVFVMLIAVFATGLAFWATVLTGAAYLIALIASSAHITTIAGLFLLALKVFGAGVATIVVSGIGAVITSA